VGMPPAVPEHGCVLRMAATAAHAEPDFERLHSALATARRQLRQARRLGLAGPGTAG